VSHDPSPQFLYLIGSTEGEGFSQVSVIETLKSNKRNFLSKGGGGITLKRINK
jgi:hypothetical protein